MLPKQEHKTTNLIGILGGTFDPIHLGHLKLATQIQKKLQLKKVLIIPAKTPPHRDAPLATIKHRLAMLKLALPHHPKLKLDLTEIKHKGHSYTVATLRALRKKFGKQISLCFIMGSDTFQEFLTWHKWPEILNLANIVVANRPKQKFKPSLPLQKILTNQQIKNKNALAQRPYGQILFINIKPLNVSATKIRLLIAKKQEVSDFLPKAVYKYIKQHKLYSQH